MIKNFVLMIFLTLSCSSLYAQQVVVPVTTYVPQTVITPVYSTFYQPVTTYYVYIPAVAPPMMVYPSYANYWIQERRCLFGGFQRTYVNINPIPPVLTYGYQSIRAF